MGEVGEPEPEDEFEEIDPVDSELRSVGDVYDIMFVVESSATGDDICCFEIESRLLLELSAEEDDLNPYLEPFLVSLRPRDIFGGILEVCCVCASNF